MTNEELLKAISNMLKSNEDYLNNNPNIFYSIQGRLLKAIGHNEALNKSEDNKKISRSGYRDWQPKDEQDYTPKQLEQIKEHMEDGYSHREAERFAGAHHIHKDFQSALNSRINPSSEYSDKFLETMKNIGLEHKQRTDSYEGEQAEAGINPQKYASHKDKKAHAEAYGDYEKEYKDFLSGLEEQDLHPNDYDEAVSKWQKEWHEKNPEAKDNMINAADAGKVYDEAKEARQKKIEEGKLNIIHGGDGAGENFAGEYSNSAAGGDDLDSSSMQVAAQMVGGAKGEGGFEAGVAKDPNAIFKEQNPEFVAALKEKLNAKLDKDPEAKERHNAMPSRDRTVKPTVAPPVDRTKQPGEVKTLSQEEIQAQYGDKYNISKKPKGDF